MRKITVFVVLIGITLSNLYGAKDIPPVPSLDSAVKKTQALRNCKVPPQIAILPPQIDKDYRECVNSYYTPDFSSSEKKLKKNGFLQENDKLLEVNRAKNFIRVYEFVYETLKKEEGFFSFSEEKVKEILICDDSLGNCYKVVDLKK